MAKSDVAIQINGKELFAITCDHCGKRLCYVDSEDNPYKENGERMPVMEYARLGIWSPDDEHDYCDECRSNYGRCACCGELLSNDELYPVANGDVVCNQCRTDNYTLCDCCGEYYHDDYMHTVANGDDVCEYCLDENYACCEHCDEYYRIDDIHQVDGYGYYCDDCYEYEDFRECDDCGGEFRREDMFEVVEDDEDCDEYSLICRGCHQRRHPEQRTSIPGYHDDYTPFRPHDSEGKIVKDDEYTRLRHREMMQGTEWEMSQGGRNYQKFLEISRALGIAHDKGECRIERDSSVPEGAEIITMPGTLEYFTKYLKLEEGFELAKKYGYRSHDGGHCGAHIHIDREYFHDSMFNPEHALIILVQNNRDWLIPFSRRDRDQMGYCSFHSDPTPFVVDDFKPSEDGGHERERNTISRLERLQSFYHGHGSALNFSGGATMEIRFFRGSLVPRTIRANHELVAMIGYAMKHLNDVQLCNVNLKWFKRFAKRKGYTNFLEYIEERGIIAS